MPPPTPMTPSPLSPPPIPTPNPLLDVKPGRPGSVEDVEEAAEAVEEEVVLAMEEELGSARDGAASGGFVSVVKQGPNRFRQLPFFFFFTPSSPPAATAAPIPSPPPEG